MHYRLPNSTTPLPSEKLQGVDKKRGGTAKTGTKRVGTSKVGGTRKVGGGTRKVGGGTRKVGGWHPIT